MGAISLCHTLLIAELLNFGLSCVSNRSRAFWWDMNALARIQWLDLVLKCQVGLFTAALPRFLWTKDLWFIPKT